MVWNPNKMTWEGNEAVSREFDAVLQRSVRPALIAPTPSTRRADPNVRVVGNMIFDPVRMSWHPLSGVEEDEEEIDWGGFSADDEAETSFSHSARSSSRLGPGPGSGANLASRASILSTHSEDWAPLEKAEGADEEFWRACREGQRRHEREMHPWREILGRTDHDRDRRGRLWDIRRVRSLCLLSRA